MTTASITNVDQLLQQGRAAMQQGDRYAARQFFRQATDLAPDYTEAWLELGRAMPLLQEQCVYIQRALNLDPTLISAREHLQAIEKLLADGAQIDPSIQSTQRPVAAASDTAAHGVSAESSTIAFCHAHPAQTTDLHCTQCSKPICGQCMLPAAVGQLCRPCARERRPPQYKVSARTILVTVPVVTVLSAGVSVIGTAILAQLPIISFYLFALVVPAAAGLLVRLIDRLTHSKRGKRMQWAVGSALWIGALPVLALAVLSMAPLEVLLLLIFMVLLTSTTAASLR